MSKERPILFSGPMVQAILAGRKTQTRRIVKPAPYQVPGYPRWFYRKGQTVYGIPESGDDFSFAAAIKCVSPYGAPGDRLWVRETWFCNSLDYPDATDHAKENLVYRADDPDPDFDGESIKDAGGWRPSIFMPRWASRITLEICSVRVERLNSISGEDAIAEGVSRLSCYGPGCPDGCNARGCIGAREAYQHLWETIHGPGSWELNQWAWVLEFRRVTD